MTHDELADQLARLPGWYDITIAVWPRADYRCEYCGRDFLASVDEYRWGWNHDHLIPESISHDDSPNNMVLSCVPCNRYKGTFDPATVTGPDASREELIAAATRKIEELRNPDHSLLEQLRELVGWDTASELPPQTTASGEN